MSKGTYKLIDAIDQRTGINVTKRKAGVIHYGHLFLMPGKLYEIEDSDDELFIKSLLGRTVTKDVTEVLIQRLDKFKIPYELGERRCCGGRITKTVTYRIVEVKLNEDT